MVDVGSTLRFSAMLYDKDPSDPTAQLVNPLSAQLTISCDGSVVSSPSISLPPATTGKLIFFYPTTVSGRYVGRWTFTMANGATAAYVQTFNVESTDPGYIVSLSEAKDHLNIPQDETADDDEILRFISAITPLVEDRIGACVPRTVTEYQDAGQRVIRLRVTPVLSVTSIGPYLTAGSTYSPSQFRVTPEGRLMLLSGGYFTLGPFEVVYKVGRSPIPSNAIQAVKIILAHLWETQRGPAGLPLQGSDDVTLIPGYGFSVPNRALELLGPDDLGPGVG